MYTRQHKEQLAMSNTLRLQTDDLPNSDLEPILKAIREHVERSPTLATWDSGHLVLNLEQIAIAIARNTHIPFPCDDAKIASTHTSTPTQQADALYRLATSIQEALAPAITSDGGPTITTLLTNLVPSKSLHRLTLNYPYTTPLTQHRYHARIAATKQQAVLRIHRVAVRVTNPHGLLPELNTALSQWAHDQSTDGRDHADFEELLQQEQQAEQGSGYQRLVNLINTETLGKLRRAIIPSCFAYLRGTVDPSSSDGARLSLVMQKRIEAFEAYLRRRDKADGDWEISYANQSFDLRDLFTHSDSFDCLPVIPKLDHNIGETSDPVTGNKEYILSLSFKHNGPVQHDSRGLSSFRYHITTYIDPTDPAYQQQQQQQHERTFIQRVLQRAILYTFMFQKFDQTDTATAQHEMPCSPWDYDPVPNFEEHLLQVLRDGTQVEKEQRLERIADLLKNRQVEDKLTRLSDWLKERIRESTATHAPIDLQLIVPTTLLQPDLATALETNQIFHDLLSSPQPEDHKRALRYITVLPSGAVSGQLVKLDVQVRLDNLHVVAPQHRESTKMRTLAENVTALAVLLEPNSQPPSHWQEPYQQLLGERPWVCIPYTPTYLNDDTRSSEHVFRYRFTFLLLTYLALVTLADAAQSALAASAQGTQPRQLFVPIVRLHQHDHTNSTRQEEYIRGMAYAVTHILSTDHRSHTQGYNIAQPKTSAYRAQNAVHSLFSALPHRFRLPDTALPPVLDRLALLVVSSRESDRKWRAESKRVLVAGSVTTFTRPTPQTVEINTTEHFAESYTSTAAWSEPWAIIDRVKRLYDEGYRHIIYVAKALYTSTLHLTTQPEEELYFFAPSILAAMLDGRSDLNIYPLFQGTYPSSRLEQYKTLMPHTSHALCTQELAGLTQLLQDPAKQVAIVYQLANGRIVNASAGFYCNICWYAVPLNMHRGLLDSTRLRTALLADESSGTPNRQKDELFQLLTLYHFADYEAAANKADETYPKLEPYQHLLGSDSVLALSIFPHLNGRGTFNGLALLSTARQALRRTANAPQPAPPAPTGDPV